MLYDPAEATTRGRAMDARTRQHLQRCIKLAEEALEAGDQPFGSVLVGADGTVLAEDRNRVNSLDATYHPCDRRQALAAAYATGIARRHPFVDGNKRVSYVLCRTSLLLNGWELAGPLVERHTVFHGLAAGEIDESALAAWLRDHARPTGVHESGGSYG